MIGNSFCNTSFRNTYKYLILVYSCTVLRCAPVEPQQHPLFNMTDDPSSVALPPSLLIVATLNNTDIKDVSMPETEMKNRKEMANFMLNDNAHDKKTNCNDKTLPPGACTAAACPLFSLFAAHNNIIKDVHITENSSKKGRN
jgi:hypothetical protein